jgi:hypothetical protein
MKHKLFLYFIFLCVCCTANAQEVSENNWYVGNTQAGEWIKFKQVWLSEGDYRFTTNAVAQGNGQTVHLEINELVLQNNIVVPSNPTNTLQLVHLGHTHLATGYYDIQLVFETGGVNCDMIFIKKDNNTSSAVLDTDTEFHINRTDKPHIAPIGGPVNASSQLAKGGEYGDNGSWTPSDGGLYSRKQILSWYKQQMYAYTPEATDRAMDYYVSEQVEAKIDFIFAHGRGDSDLTSDIEDRSYPSASGFGCRLLKKLAEAINRSKYAKDNLKIAYFSDNAVFPLIYAKAYPGQTFSWTSAVCQEYIWTYVFKAFFDNVPRNMLFEMAPGIIPIQLWSSNANYTYPASEPKGSRKIKEFLVYITSKMQETYGVTPGWILPKDFLDNDSRLASSGLVYGTQAWFSWGGNIIPQETCPVTGKKFAFALNGGRYPLDNVWLGDWNPDTNAGTHKAGQTLDYHKSALDAQGKPVIRPAFEKAVKDQAEWMVLESWCDWREGSTWYRSDHAEYAFPNQHIALVREFADQNSESIILEVEACDEYYNRSTGNRGGTYRVNWYNELEKDFWDADKEIDLDVYRPLHKLSALTPQGRPSEYIPVIDFAVGNKDVWGWAATGAFFAHQADGIPANKWSARVNTTVKKLALGGNYAWCIRSDNNKVMRAELPVGQTNALGSWVDITSGINVQDIATSLKEGWAVDTDGKVYYRDLAGKKPWMNVPGKLKSIAAEDQSVWGFTPEDSLVRMSSESKARWDTIPNPYQLKKISGGSSEIWGVTADNKVYRINASGDGDWQFVAEGYNNVGVGVENVWLSDPSGYLYSYKISGFENTTAFVRGTDTETGIYNAQASIKDLYVYPTPFTDKLQVGVVADKPAEITIRIINLNGKLLTEQRTEIQSGSNSIPVNNIQSLNQGIYILSVVSADTVRSFKIIKKN